MPLLNLRLRALPRPGSLLRAGYATQKSRSRISPRVPPNTVYTPPPSIPPSRRSTDPSQATQTPQDSSKAQNDKETSVGAISSALQSTTPDNNNLLSPVHIPSDPDGVLNESHPATSILANSSIVVTRQLELMNVMLGFEQANKYVIMDPQGAHIGYMAERDLGMGNMMARQMFSTHRSFTTHVFDKHGKEVLRFHRPFAWISSRIGIYDPLEVGQHSLSSSTGLATTTPGALSTEVNPETAQVSQLPLSDMRTIGEAQQQWAPLRRKYNLFLHRPSHLSESNTDTPQLTAGELPLSNSKQLQISSKEDVGQFGQFAYVDEPFLSWDFSLLSDDKRLIGSVNRNFSGFGREIFTDTGVYALRMDAVSLAQEPGHLISKSGQESEPANAGMTLDQRAVMLATAVSVDFDYFSRKSGGMGAGGFMPMWWPFGGGADGEAGAEAGAAGGAEGETGGALGEVGKGEGAMAGAGTMVGYEAMQRGAYGDDASPTAEQQNAPDLQAGQSPPEAPDRGSGSEDVWGNDDDPWGGGGPPAGDGGGDGGEGGGLWDTLGDFFGDE